MKTEKDFSKMRSLKWMCMICLTLIVFTTSLSVKAQTTIATSFVNNNASSVVIFNLYNSNTYGINIHSVQAPSGTSGLQTASLWTKPVTGINMGAPGAVSAANGWTEQASQSVTTVASTTATGTACQTILSGLNVNLAPNSYYLVCVSLSSSIRYSTVGVQTCTFSGSGVSITSCTSNGYGGTLASPTNHPRGFVGALTFTPCTPTTISVTACDSYTWSVNSVTYNASGTYTSVTGCHTDILNLTIVPSTSNTTYQTTGCDWTWSVNGVTYTSSGIYTSVIDCHTETLNLTVYSNSCGITDIVSTMLPYTWACNGVTYTACGTYTCSSINAGGQIHTQVLRCDYPFSQTVNAACNYTWHGVTYTTSGAYTYSYNPYPQYSCSQGPHCITTETLYLTITPCPVYLKFFIEGYWDGASAMRPVRMNGSCQAPNGNTVTDFVTVELRAPSTYSLIESSVAIVMTDGTCTANFASTYTGSYFIVVKGCNFLETWSAAPVNLPTLAPYDFSTALSKAYDDNLTDGIPSMKLISSAPTRYAFFSGDLNEYGDIGLSDLILVQNDVNAGAVGCLCSDLNGDGAANMPDKLILINNLFQWLKRP